jgi:hypothetical protein
VHQQLCPFLGNVPYFSMTACTMLSGLSRPWLAEVQHTLYLVFALPHLLLELQDTRTTDDSAHIDGFLCGTAW